APPPRGAAAEGLRDPDSRAQREADPDPPGERRALVRGRVPTRLRTHQRARLHDQLYAARARGAPRPRPLLPRPQVESGEPAARTRDRSVVRRALQARDAQPSRERGRLEPYPGAGAPRPAPVVARSRPFTAPNRPLGPTVQTREQVSPMLPV